MVAPRAGAWIEISVYPAALISCWVAPRAGAWIEIANFKPPFIVLASLPVRERGLKYSGRVLLWLFRRVAPRAGAWIEIRYKIAV